MHFQKDDPSWTCKPKPFRTASLKPGAKTETALHAVCLVQSKILAGLARQEQGVLTFSLDEIEAWTTPTVRLWIWKLAFKLDQGEAWSDRMIYLYAKGSLSSTFKGKVVSMLVQLNQKKKFQKAWLHKDLDHSQRKSVMWFGGAIFASTHQWFSVLLRFPLPRLSHFHPSFWVRDWRITVAAELVGVVAEITRIKPLTGERTGRMWCMQPPSPAEATLTVQVRGSACSIRSRSRVRGRLQPFVSTLSCYHLAFISWVSSSSPLSSSAAAPSPAEAELSLNFNFVSGTSCRCAKGYNDRNYFCNHRSSRQSVTSIQDRASFPHQLIERLKYSVYI